MIILQSKNKETVKLTSDDQLSIKHHMYQNYSPHIGVFVEVNGGVDVLSIDVVPASVVLRGELGVGVVGSVVEDLSQLAFM